MEGKKKGKNKLLIFSVLVLAGVLVSTLFPVHGEAEIYDTVVRLHVLANSDSEEDQQLKLKVRDEIIGIITPAVSECDSQEAAIAAIGSVMNEIEQKALQTVKDNGYDYDISVTVGREYYPTKDYESCSFPEGEYVSLKVCIGDAEGQNWWCCLFPPLCLSAASEQAKIDNEEAFIQAGLTSEQYRIITDTDDTKYKVRFKILETLQGLFE